MMHSLSVDAVCRLIETLLPGGYPVIDEVAQLLRVSSRSLQRMLNEEGVSYSGLVERCRCRAACDLLSHTLDPVQDIAINLGYRDASSFTRAFRRWTGATPRAWRNRSRGQLDNWPATATGAAARSSALA